MRRHRELDYSGDVGVEAWGETLAEVFEEATLGLFELVATNPPPPSRDRSLSVRAGDEAALLVDWLGEVIASAAVHGEVYSSVRVDACDGHEVRGTIAGAPADTAADALRFDVKAATYHQLLVEGVDGGYHARVIFDL